MQGDQKKMYMLLNSYASGFIVKDLNPSLNVHTNCIKAVKYLTKRIYYYCVYYCTTCSAVVYPSRYVVLPSLETLKQLRGISIQQTTTTA